ncbi:MAG TPA: hypothetical protein VF941_20455 [Clostridia bacterium]
MRKAFNQIKLSEGSMKENLPLIMPRANSSIKSAKTDRDPSRKIPAAYLE